MIAKTPKVPYYTVIFTSTLKLEDPEYHRTADRMLELAQNQEGFLGFESAREHAEITISYWKDLDSIRAWKNNSEHLVAQERGKNEWYSSYMTRIAKVERDYGFGLTV